MISERPTAPLPISAVILTFNSAASIRRTLSALTQVAGEVLVVDSFSTDDTKAICESLGCTVVQRPFVHYADQRNWAIDTLPFRFPWQLHVDADEELTPELVRAIQALDLDADDLAGYMIGRKIVFMGQVLRFGSIAKTWHFRLFRTGRGRCENRLYDQHFVAMGAVGRIDAFMLDHQEDTISEWTARHNRWSDLEADELASRSDVDRSQGQVKAAFNRNAIERRRFLKKGYYGLPLFWRPLVYFLYRYFACLGFLDGKAGLIYHVLQGFWFRFLVDTKILERRNARHPAPSR